jgi:predicted restriction endonuclease
MPKRKRESFCKICNLPILSGRSYCTIHKVKENTFEDLTLQELRDRGQKNERVRMHARKVYDRSNMPKECVLCGYKKHYEICHLKPIHSFPLTTKLSVVNVLDNLVALCRNHHWEYDHRSLNPKEIDNAIHTHGNDASQHGLIALWNMSINYTKK